MSNIGAYLEATKPYILIYDINYLVDWLSKYHIRSMTVLKENKNYLHCLWLDDAIKH